MFPQNVYKKRRQTMAEKNAIHIFKISQKSLHRKRTRDRLILELQTRCGMRIGEVLNLRAPDITDRKLIIP
jgi:site-specific recombinase XerD